MHSEYTRDTVGVTPVDRTQIESANVKSMGKVLFETLK